jgi:two-component system response regulator FlrC
MANLLPVLVIEDEPILRELVSDWLVAAGYEVISASNGREGVAQARARRPALVVTDMRMPGCSGACVIAEVLALYPGLPIVAISAHFRAGGAIGAENALALGAARALAKPFRRAEMVGTVAELIGAAPH